MMGWVRLGEEGAEGLVAAERPVNTAFTGPTPLCPLGLTQFFWFQVPLFESSTCELEQPGGSQGESVKRFEQNPGKRALRRLHWVEALRSSGSAHCCTPRLERGAMRSVVITPLLWGSCHQLGPGLQHW